MTASGSGGVDSKLASWRFSILGMQYSMVPKQKLDFECNFKFESFEFEIDIVKIIMAWIFAAQTMVHVRCKCGVLWCRADSRLAPSQWETSLQSNAVSHWLGANLESALWCVLTMTRNVDTSTGERKKSTSTDDCTCCIPARRHVHIHSACRLSGRGNYG